MNEFGTLILFPISSADSDSVSNGALAAEHIVRISDDGVKTITFYTDDGNNFSTEVGTCAFQDVLQQFYNARCTTAPPSTIRINPTGVSVAWSTSHSGPWLPMPATAGASIYLQITVPSTYVLSGLNDIIGGVTSGGITATAVGNVITQNSGTAFALPTIPGSTWLSAVTGSANLFITGGLFYWQ